MKHHLMTALMSGSLLGCSQPTAPASAPQELLEPPPEGMGTQLRMSATIEPGHEKTVCQYFALPEIAGGPDVVRFEHRYTAGSHHLVLFPTLLDRPLVDGAFECDTAETPLSDLFVDGVAYGDQLTEGELTFPPGVGYHFEEHAMVMMQAHYLNATVEPIDADVRLNLWLAQEPVTQQAGTFLFFHPVIYVPPAPAGARATMRCAVDHDITLLTGLSHMHRRGTHFESFLDGAPHSEPLSLHTTDDWASPSPARFEPPVAIAAGQTMEFSCDFVNDRDAPTLTGFSAAEDEMCAFAGSYYPKGSKPFENCAVPSSSITFYGDKTCAESIACLDAHAPESAQYDSVERALCANETCPGASLAYYDLWRCEAASSCAFGSLTSCLPAACPDEWAACQATTCN